MLREGQATARMRPGFSRGEEAPAPTIGRKASKKAGLWLSKMLLANLEPAPRYAFRVVLSQNTVLRAS